MSCKTCNKVVADSDRIVCRGFCGATFHVLCAKIDFPLLDQLGLYERNVFWMCDPCAALFSSNHFRELTGRFNQKTDVVPEAIVTMKMDISQLSNLIAALAAKVDVQSQNQQRRQNRWPAINGSTSQPNTNTPKKRRLVDGSPDEPVNKPTTQGTKKLCGAIKTVPLAEDLIWLYLSAFDPPTSDEDIATFVKECLNTDFQPSVTKLVPKGKDLTKLTFVSFKVGLKMELRDVALNPESWPTTISFREFEDNQAKNVNKILTSIHTTSGPLVNSNLSSDGAEMETA